MHCGMPPVIDLENDHYPELPNNQGIHDSLYPDSACRVGTWYDILPNSTFWSQVSPRDDRLLLCVEEGDKNILHVIEINDNGQLYGVVQLTSHTHFQKLMFKLVSDVLPNFWYEDEDDDEDNDDYQVPLVRFYPKTSNHSNDFLFVHNCGPLLEETISSVDFGQIRDVLHSKKRGSGTKRNENQPSCLYGYATMSYKVGPSGYNIPTLLTDTDSEFTMSLFLVGTSIIRSSLIPQQFRYVPDLARQKFPSGIVEGNFFEGLTLHVSSKVSPLTPHKDSNNPPEGTKSSVVICVSKSIGSERFGAVFYNKKSVEDTVHRLKFLEKMCNEFVELYHELPEYRKTVTWNNHKLLSCSPDSSWVYSNHFSIPCSLDPLGYHALFVHTLSKLIARFKLTYFQVHGLMSCFEIYPHTAFFFSLSVDKYLESNPTLPKDDFFKTIREISVSMIVIKDEYMSKNAGTKRLNRFRSQKCPLPSDVPTARENYAAAAKRTHLSLAIWKWHPTKPKKKETVISVFQQCLALFKETSRHGNGPLSCQHEMAILAILGVLPPWMRDVAFFDKVIDTLNNMFSYPTKMFSKDPHKQWGIMSTIGEVLTRKCGGNWTVGMVENFLCKFVRIKGEAGSDTNYYDVHHESEVLLEYRSGLLTVTVGGKSFPKQDGMLCSSWGFGGGVHSAHAISVQVFRDFDDDEDMPKNKDLSRVYQRFGNCWINKFEACGSRAPFSLELASAFNSL